MEKFEQLPEFDKHKLVSFFYDKATGLRGFIGIHNTKQGIAVGGTRYWNYKSEDEALADALKLSRAMTYKCALAKVPYGGGKAVIIANPALIKDKQKLLVAYARAVNMLHGTFYTGEDVGISEQDVSVLMKESKFMIGRPGFAGDPSPWASLGVFYAIQAGLTFLFGSGKIEGHTFAIKGAGKVGGELLRLLYENGGSIVAADVNLKNMQEIKKRFKNIRIVKQTEIHRQRVDVYCPCALGNEFSKTTISELNCKMICGGANNQLSSSEAGEILHKRKILYIPDYLANAGGLINVAAELDKDGYKKERVELKVKQIKNTAEHIIELSQKTNMSTSKVADGLAMEMFYK